MAKIRKTYIINHKTKAGVSSYSLSEWCQLKGLGYSTALCRIWRSKPKNAAGVVYIDSADPLLNLDYKPRLVKTKSRRANKLSRGVKLSKKQVLNGRTGSSAASSVVCRRKGAGRGKQGA